MPWRKDDANGRVKARIEKFNKLQSAKSRERVNTFLDQIVTAKNPRDDASDELAKHAKKAAEMKSLGGHVFDIL